MGVTFIAGKMREVGLRWFGYVNKRCVDAREGGVRGWRYERQR